MLLTLVIASDNDYDLDDAHPLQETVRRAVDCA